MFLSYARTDEALARRLASEIRKCGWSVWFDRELPAHGAFSDV
ncbi:MAG: TIR domain-containing protein, partial [Sphingomicrobium sp.]